MYNTRHSITKCLILIFIFLTFCLYLIYTKVNQPGRLSTFFPIDKHETISNRYVLKLNTTESNVFPHLSTPRIPQEIFNPNSPFFGMIFKDTYGLPVTRIIQNMQTETKEDWKDHFPSLMSSLNKLNDANPMGNQSLFTQNVSVAVDRTELNFGEEFVATITSIDGEGRVKKFGGDYYRARLIRDNTTKPDGIPCRIIDNENGTYTVKAPLLLEGILTLQIKLVMTIEAVSYMLKLTNFRAYGPTYIAMLESQEKVKCNVNMSIFFKFKDKDLCDYSNPRNNEPWYCNKPPSGNCSKIVNIESFAPDEKNSNFGVACSTFACHKKIEGVMSIRVGKNDTPKLEGSSQFCKNTFNQSYSSFKQITGFVKDTRWQLLLCDYSYKSIAQLKSSTCLNNKAIFFFGDSTIRQFFNLIAENYFLKTDGPDNSKIWQQPRIAYDSTGRNITLYYRAHGPPLRNPGPPYTRPYISDSIVDLPVGGKGVYVVFNIGAHLFFYEPHVYLHRLKGIKEAILKHQKQYPETKFILRGMNTIEWDGEWNVYRFEIILRNTFKHTKNLIFLNLWDLTNVWPIFEYHPHDHVLREEAILMLNYICT